MMPPTVADISEGLKTAGVVLTTASALGYAGGYLVMRARAFALGTDPGFAFIDQAYVWAGIRLLMMVLYALLLAAIPLLLVRSVWHGLLHGAPRVAIGIEYVAAVLAGIAIIATSIAIFNASNLIFASPQAVAANPVQSAVLGRNGIGTTLFIASAGLAALLGLWLRSRLARTGIDAVVLLISAMAALQCLLLPIQHGFFFADRQARGLGATPKGVEGTHGTLWIVDRGAGDRVVLFGRDPNGAPRLIPVKAEVLDGIAITGVATLGDILVREPTS